MTKKGESLAEKIADDILAMITIDKKFSLGDKLPNENVLSSQLKVSRTTLREAIRILVAHNVLEIQRGKGTFVKRNPSLNDSMKLEELSGFPMDVKDLYEMRLIFEPQSAYYAAKRATDKELERILYYGKLEEEQILKKMDRTEVDQAFHKSIAKATHNEFMNRLMPILYQAIGKGVILSYANEDIVQNTLHDHRMIMEFLAKRDALGAKTAMELHIIHAMRGFGIENE
ncbi:FadR family transcriptional regulator [Caproiciproducens galactitolivorans]|uniref:Putative L-lactate dehydrogenase operon regulatory protein n=1 Tax=Caproiciproducens galactitolivorans TaxID=642589 RepID=A0A4Z0YDY7_9FIRM|nr:FadR/GntR family transcriptional regulator [Caproiciproducens galactitolivorans]QEY34557.1 FadR family transcriptional regulator [Caproiciproducens galactitolivorans]TGJ77655.1 putative L-lactate dehydrogenase operon regulatory protein [Caproiciproducens galactitolivorans]